MPELSGMSGNDPRAPADGAAKAGRPESAPAEAPSPDAEAKAARPSREPARADGAPRRGRRWAWVLGRWTAIAVVVILVARVSGCAERLFYHPIREPTPVPRHAPEGRVVRFESRDGTRLCGWFVPAAASAREENGAPSILFVHGNAGNMNWHYDFVADLPFSGFNLFIFDYRGYGESEGSASRRDLLIDDTMAALDAMLAQPEVDPARVGIFAQSLGAAIAINVLAERPEVRAAALESPFASWRLAAATALGGAEPGPLARALAAMAIGDERAPVDVVARCRAPILIVHGDADWIVPIMHGRLIRDAAPDRVTLIEYPGGDHNTLSESHPESKRAWMRFLAEHLRSDDEERPVSPPAP